MVTVAFFSSKQVVNEQLDILCTEDEIYIYIYIYIYIVIVNCTAGRRKRYSREPLKTSSGGKSPPSQCSEEWRKVLK